jgi:hypothetical protein
MTKKQALLIGSFTAFFLADLFLNSWLVGPLQGESAVDALSAAKLLATLGWFVSLVSYLAAAQRNAGHRR